MIDVFFVLGRGVLGISIIDFYFYYYCEGFHGKINVQVVANLDSIAKKISDEYDHEHGLRVKFEMLKKEVQAEVEQERMRWKQALDAAIKQAVEDAEHTHKTSYQTATAIEKRSSKYVEDSSEKQVWIIGPQAQEENISTSDMSAKHNIQMQPLSLLVKHGAPHADAKVALIVVACEIARNRPRSTSAFGIR